MNTSCTYFLIIQIVTLYSKYLFQVTPPVNGFQIPLPGGKSISYNPESGVLRIQLSKENSKIKVPPANTKPSDEIINSIEVRDTCIPQKGYGAFATNFIQEGMFLGFYEGELIRSREMLDEIVAERIKNCNNGKCTGSTAMDYVMSIDGGMTFIDGYNRAQDRSSFSTVHLNHADKGSNECNCIRLLEDDRVAFFTSRDIQINEELCFDYGSNFWIGKEDSKISSKSIK